MTTRICEETPELFPAIRTLLAESFPTAAEADLVEALRRDGDILLALVALHGDAVIGHIVLSRMRAPMPAAGIAPLAVRADQQRRGVGSDLVRAGIAGARSLGLSALFVLGDPAYYRRFGFRAETAAGFECAFAGPYFMALALDCDAAPPSAGRIAYAPAFERFA